MSRLKKLNNKRQNRVIYERTREEKAPVRYPGLIYFFILLAFGALVYILFFSNLLEIKNVSVSGYSKNDEIGKKVNEYRQSNLFGNNILFINIDALEKKIGEDSRVKEVHIKRELPNSLRIEVLESTQAIVWNSAGESFIIDDRGYVIEKNNNINLPPVYDNANISVALGERVASPTFIKYIIDVWGNFELVTGVKPEKIIILDILSDVHIKSKSTWTVYLDSTKDPISQLENLNKVLQSAKESGHTKLQYIDMRLQDKVFYR